MLLSDVFWTSWDRIGKRIKRRISEKNIDRLRSVFLFLMAITIGALLWDNAARLFFTPYLLPRPASVFWSGWESVLSGVVPRMVIVSLSRIGVGYAIGCILGISLGLLMGSSRILGETFDPLVMLIRPISPVAMIPIAIVWFGIGEAAKYFIISYGVFFVTLLNTIDGVRHTPLIRKRAAMCLGARRMSMFLRITLPSAVPYINVGMRVALGGAFMSVVAAEMIAANEGVGYYIMLARILVQTQNIFVGLATLGVMGFLADRLFRYLSGIFLMRYLRVSR
jgi:ABC-type nitrate/sulfonate/bicarbonate transport system permease component